MKKFNWLLLAVLLTIVAIVPNTAAAFADQPVAFVVFDNSGNVTRRFIKCGVSLYVGRIISLILSWLIQIGLKR